MAKAIVKKFSSADETRQFRAHGHVDVLEIGDGTVMRGVFEPGWKWSNDVKPIAGTKSCETLHSGYVLSGRMHVVMDDGQQFDVEPGDYMFCPPGHDAWTVGDEACVILDVAGAASYARPSRGAGAGAGAAQPGTP
jgi:mannose-6-phosphate isomerase-like protein (cupin superfamily)